MIESSLVNKYVDIDCGIISACKTGLELDVCVLFSHYNISESWNVKKYNKDKSEETVDSGTIHSRTARVSHNNYLEKANVSRTLYTNIRKRPLLIFADLMRTERHWRTL